MRRHRSGPCVRTASAGRSVHDRLYRDSRRHLTHRPGETAFPPVALRPRRPRRCRSERAGNALLRGGPAHCSRNNNRMTGYRSLAPALTVASDSTRRREDGVRSRLRPPRKTPHNGTGPAATRPSHAIRLRRGSRARCRPRTCCLRCPGARTPSGEERNSNGRHTQSRTGIPVSNVSDRCRSPGPSITARPGEHDDDP